MVLTAVELKLLPVKIWGKLRNANFGAQKRLRWPYSNTYNSDNTWNIEVKFCIMSSDMLTHSLLNLHAIWRWSSRKVQVFWPISNGMTRSGFVYRGALNTLIVIVIVIVMSGLSRNQSVPLCWCQCVSQSRVQKSYLLLPCASASAACFSFILFRNSSNTHFLRANLCLPLSQIWRVFAFNSATSCQRRSMLKHDSMASVGQCHFGVNSNSTDTRNRKSWKINQMVAAFLTRVHVFSIYKYYHCPLSDSVRSVV